MPELTLASLRDRFGRDALTGGLRGIERETLRVDRTGQLAQTPHAPALGSALTHPWLTTDYSEALLEFVTPPVAASNDALSHLMALHAFVQQRLPDERLWPASMPCIGSNDEDVPIAQYGSSNEGMFRTVYRRGLGHRYGRVMQAIAGIHFNYSPPPAFWRALAEATGVTDTPAARSEQLMGLVRNFRRLAWSIAYLFGASPVLARSFRPSGHARLEPLDDENWFAPFATSLRMSDLGYRNTTQAGPGISANSLERYVSELRAATATIDPAYEAIGIEVDGEYRQLSANVLQIENEYYSSIRPKPAGRTLRPVAALARDGVAYVELRTLDSDPAEPVGLGPVQACTCEMLLLLCLLNDSPPIEAPEQAEIDRRELAVAWEGRRPGLQIERGGALVALADWGQRLCDQLDVIAEMLGTDDYRHAASVARRAFVDPAATPSARMIETLTARRIGLLELGLEYAEAHRAVFDSYRFEPGGEQQLIDTAADSLASTRELEAGAAPPFAEYLAAYFAE